MRDLSLDEEVALDAIAEAWDRMKDLPEIHRDDLQEIKYHVHALQNIIACRPALERYFVIPHGMRNEKE
jgi:hypothetical protein